MSTRMIRLTEEHRKQVQAMRTRAEQWLRSKGLEQFNGSNAPAARAALEEELSAGWMVGLVNDEGELISVAAIKPADRDFWTEEEASDPDASWIGRFMVSEDGKGYGEELLEEIIQHESKAGKKRIRLDCWKTNTALHEYYKRRGFRHLRTVETPGRMSGALFEREI